MTGRTGQSRPPAGSAAALGRPADSPGRAGPAFLNSRWIWLALAAAAVLPFLPSLMGGFVFDDTGVILENPAVWQDSPWEVLRSHYWPGRPETGLYRPWTLLSYWITAQLFGRHPLPFHAGNLLLHAAACLLLARVLLRAFPRRRGAAWGAAFLFALHPLHVEAVASIVGRAELWAAFWVLAAYSLALKGSRAGLSPGLSPLLSALAFGLAALSKESAAGMLALPLLHALPGLGWGREATRAQPGEDSGAAGRTFWTWTLMAWAGALGLALLLRIRILGSLLGLERVSLADNILAYVDPWTRLAGAAGFQWILIQRLLFPWSLSADHSYPQLIPGPGWMAAGAALLILAAVCLVLALRRRALPWLWGMAWMAAAGLLTSNLLFPVGTVLAERLAYLPSAGALWLLALAYGWIQERTRGRIRSGLWVLAALWAGFLAVQTPRQSLDWRSDLSLFQAAVQTSPRSSKAWANLSAAYLKADRVEEALEAARKAASLLPDHPASARTLAAALARSGQAEEALEALEPARTHGERDPNYLVQMGNVLLELGRGAEAEQAFRRALDRIPVPDAGPGFVSSLSQKAGIGLASSLALQERWPESREAWRRVARAEPENAEYRRAWAYVLWQAGSPDSAETLYRGLIRDEPQNPQVLNDAAWFLARSGRDPQEAAELAGRAFALDPGEQTGDTWMEALIRARGCSQALAALDSLAGAGLEETAGFGRSLDSTLLDALRRDYEERCGEQNR